jgi:hypothetical protein
MTLKSLTLDEYFHKIVNQPKTKEPTMFDNVKASVQMAIDKFSSLWTKPTTFVDNVVDEDDGIEDGWSFAIYTGKWEDCDGNLHPSQYTLITESNDSTWMNTVDTILDVLSKHYGYDIKSQVYYSVAFPLNQICEYTELPYAGYGRSLNEDILQQLLLAYPEVYEVDHENFKLTPKK